MVVQFAPDVAQMLLISVFVSHVVDNHYQSIFPFNVRGKFEEVELVVYQVISAFLQSWIFDFHKNFYLQNINLSLTKHKGWTRKFWPKVLVLSVPCTDQVQQGLYKNDLWPMFSNMARASQVNIKQSTIQISDMVLENEKYTAYDGFHGNPVQERTNQKTWIYLKTALPYNVIYFHILCFFQYQCILYERTSRSRFHGNYSPTELSERILSR